MGQKLRKAIPQYSAKPWRRVERPSMSTNSNNNDHGVRAIIAIIAITITLLPLHFCAMCVIYMILQMCK